MTQKVFGIGFHKTGTTTLGKALEILGYEVLGNRKDLTRSLSKNNFGEAKKLTMQYDAFQDNPWPIIYKKLDLWHPKAKFVLTVRDKNRWLASALAHFGNRHTDMREWIYEHGAPLGHEETYIQRYEQHNKEVKRYFKDRPTDLLVVNWSEGHGWKELCSFLDKPTPDFQLPHLNKKDQRS